LLGGVDDDPDLVQPDLAGGESLAGSGVLLGQQPGQSQPAGGLLACRPGQPRQPGVGAGLGRGLGHAASVGVGRQRQPQLHRPRLHARQPRDGLAQRLVVQIRDRRPTRRDQCLLDLAEQCRQPGRARLSHARARRSLED
jgi:hypothetical protein